MRRYGIKEYILYFVYIHIHTNRTCKRLIVSNDIKVQVWGTRPYSAFSQVPVALTRWFAPFQSCIASVRLIVFKHAKHVNQT
jgi:hypothetical protein